jgi:hypothetical protein
MHRLRDICLIAVHAENDDANRRRAAADDLPRGFDPIQERHADVEDGDVGLQFERFAHGIAAIASLGDNAPLAAILEDLAQTLPQHRVIVAQQHAKLTHAPPPAC